MAYSETSDETRTESQAEAERSPLEAQRTAADEAGMPDEHPEVLVGAAFAGGFVLAQLLKRLGGGSG
jgi:hypothetical protein